MTNAGLRALIERDEILPAFGVYDALSARILEQAGGEVVYVSGSAVSSSVHGGPDVGLTTMTEMATRIRQIAMAVDRPVFADADAGYGSPINVRRTVVEFERAGASGIHLEDQVMQKRCGHFEGKSVVTPEEMVARIRAAVDARLTDEFVIIARTDALAGHGFEEAMNRLATYRDAGADVLFLEAPETVEEFRDARKRLDGPLLANLPAGGKTPLVTAQDLEDIGYDIVLYPGVGIKAVLQVLPEIYEAVVEHGSHEPVLDRLASWERRNEITGLADFVRLEERYTIDEES